MAVSTRGLREFLRGIIDDDDPDDPWGPVASRQLPGTPNDQPLADIIESSPKDWLQAIAQGVRPATTLASFLGGPPGAVAGIADVEAMGLAEGREPEAWERGLGALGAIPVAGAGLRILGGGGNAGRILGKGSMFPDRLNKLAQLADESTPYRDTPEFAKAGYAPLFQFLRDAVSAKPRMNIHKDEIVLPELKDTLDLLNPGLLKFLKLPQGVGRNPEVTEPFIDVLKQPPPEVMDLGTRLRSEYAPQVDNALKQYTDAPHPGIRSLLRSPIEEVANSNAITDTLLRWLGLDKTKLFRGQTPSHPLGISWSTDAKVTPNFGVKQLTDTVPSREILDSFLTNPRAFKSHPSEAEFIRLHDDILSQLSPQKSGRLEDIADTLKRYRDAKYPEHSNPMNVVGIPVPGMKQVGDGLQATLNFAEDGPQPTHLDEFESLEEALATLKTYITKGLKVNLPTTTDEFNNLYGVLEGNLLDHFPPTVVKKLLSAYDYLEPDEVGAVSKVSDQNALDLTGFLDNLDQGPDDLVFDSLSEALNQVSVPVSGAIGELLGKYPQMTNADIEAILKNAVEFTGKNLNELGPLDILGAAHAVMTKPYIPGS